MDIIHLAIALSEMLRPRANLLLVFIDLMRVFPVVISDHRSHQNFSECRIVKTLLGETCFIQMLYSETSYTQSCCIHAFQMQILISTSFCMYCLLHSANYAMVLNPQLRREFVLLIQTRVHFI